MAISAVTPGRIRDVSPATSMAMSNCRVPPLEHLARRDAARRANRPLQVGAGHGIDGDPDALARGHVGALVLGQLGGDLDARRIDQIGDQLPGIRRVADAVSGITAPEKTTPPNAIVFIRSVTKPSNGARICRFWMLRRATSTATWAFIRCSRSTAREAVDAVPPALHVHFELREAVARFLEEQLVLRGQHGADQFVGARVELGPPGLEARLQQRHLVVGGLRRGFGLGFRNLLIRELEVEGRLLERELLLGRVEVDDDVAAFHGGAVGDQLDDGHAGRRLAAP